MLLKETLFRPLFLVTIPHVRHFLATKEQQERTRAQERHLYKLRSLGLHSNKRVEGKLKLLFLSSLPQLF